MKILKRKVATYTISFKPHLTYVQILRKRNGILIDSCHIKRNNRTKENIINWLKSRS